MDILRRHIINQNIAIHELKLTHSSKVIVIFPLIFISGDLNLEFQSEPQVQDAEKNVNSKLWLSETLLEATCRHSLAILGTMKSESQQPPDEVLNISSGLIARQDVGNRVQNLLADLSSVSWICALIQLP